MPVCLPPSNGSFYTDLGGEQNFTRCYPAEFEKKPPHCCWEKTPLTYKPHGCSTFSQKACKGMMKFFGWRNSPLDKAGLIFFLSVEFFSIAIGWLKKNDALRTTLLYSTWISSCMEPYPLPLFEDYFSFSKAGDISSLKVIWLYGGQVAHRACYSWHQCHEVLDW